MPNPKPTLEDALALVLEAHRGQKDRYGSPYILHPLRVMQRMRTPEERVVAILHDVVEDSPITLDELRQRGYPEAIVHAVDCLTKRQGEEYTALIDRALSNPLALRVKLADLEDNMDLKRLDRVQAKDVDRFNRYLEAWRRLSAPPQDAA